MYTYVRPKLLKLGESIAEGPNLAVDIGDQHLDLSLGVEKLDGLRVRVIPNSEWARNGRSEVYHFLLGVLEALGDEVDWLVFCNRIFLCSRLLRIERQQLRLT